MEFIPGETLQERIDRTGPLDVAEVLRIGRQTAEGLAAAHAQGLIHRDVKPANVLIEGGPPGRVKLTDFGLARAADDASISQSGVLAGTPLYMAPEQARGESLDHRADLFSLGSVLYATLTGHAPFRAATTLAVLKRVAEEGPRPIREIIPEVPVWLCRIVEKLHAKDPTARFRSAREVADLLADCEAQWQAHGQLKKFARIPGGRPAPRRRASWGRRLVELAAAAVVIAAGLFVVVSVAYLRTEIRPAPLYTPLPVVDPSAPVTWGQVVDWVGGSTFSETADQLTISVPGWHANQDPSAPYQNLASPSVMRRAAGDFDLQVRVPPFRRPVAGTDSRQSRHSYVAAGLFVGRDGNNFLRLLRAADGESGLLVASVEAFRQGTVMTARAIGVPDQPTFLRVERRGDRLRCLYGTDGKSWSELAVDPAWIGELEVGVTTVNTTVAPHVAQFEALGLKDLTPAQPADAVVQPLRDLVAAKDRFLTVTIERVKAGKASQMDQVLAEIDLTEARVRLAGAEGGDAAVVTLLQDLVTQREEERRLTAIMVEAGVAPPDDLHSADGRLADAKARLGQAKSGASDKK
jgi:hypothetical protein